MLSAANGRLRPADSPQSNTRLLVTVHDPLHDRAHCFVRDTQVAGHVSEPLSLRPNRDLMPALGWNARPFGGRGIPAIARSPSRVEQPSWIQEGDQG